MANIKSKINSTRSIDETVDMVNNPDTGLVKELEEVKQSRKQITIYTEYLTLAKKWIEQEKLNAELIFVSGEAEGFLVNGLCDLCVSIADKEGIEKNNLKEIAEIKKSELCIFSKNEFYQKFNEMIFINEYFYF